VGASQFGNALVSLVLLLAVTPGCGKAAARDGERLPGRTRPLFEHNWPHPRDLKFSANRFTPPDPTSALVTTTSGLRAYVVVEPRERVVLITAAVPLGRSLEQGDEVGAAEALSRLLSQQIDDRLGPEFIGRVETNQDVDLTRWSLQAPAAEWQSALAALIETLRQARLDPAAIAAYRTGPGFTRQTRGLGGPAFRPAVELSRMLANYPLAPPDAGLTVRPEAIRHIASRTLRPSAVTIGIGGPVARDDARRALETLTAGWPAPRATSDIAPADAAPKNAADRSRTIDESGYTTWIAIGHPMPKIVPTDEAAVAVMTDLLNIRLNIAVREIRGLANATQLQISATTRHDGLLHVRSGARPESVAPIIRYSLQELATIHEAGGAPTPEELEQVKGGLVLSKWQSSLDGARTSSATYATETARYGSLDRLMKWPEAVRAVTAQAVTAAAQKYIHPDAMGITIIGQIDAVRQARHPRWPVALDEVLPARNRQSDVR
jgi:predicted Zn-dependent peptidase